MRFYHRTSGTVRPVEGTGDRRRSARSDRGQVAMLLVIGIVLIMVLGASIFIASTTEVLPVVADNIAQHDAYRAVQAGLNEYLYLINTDPVRVICDSGNAGITPACNTTTGFNMKFDAWNQVPGSGTGTIPGEWFAIHNPVFDTTHGLVTVTIDGTVENGGRYQYNSANIAFQQANNFLTNAWWSVHGIYDPVIQGNTRSCTPDTTSVNGVTYLSLAWGFVSTDPTTGKLTTNGAVPYSSGCLNKNLAYNPPGTWFNGPMFSDDPMFVCQFGTTPGKTYVGNPGEPINTADPYSQPGTVNNNSAVGSASIQEGPWSSYGCDNNYYYGVPTTPPSYSTSIVHPIVKPPSDVVGKTALTKVAKANGCLYSGPTQIVFDGKNGIIVSSPDTPTSGTSASGYPIDANNNSGDQSTCLPKSGDPSGPIPLPQNGVIFVQTVSSGCSTKANPLQSGYYGSTSTSNCEGDALVGNRVYDPSDYQNNVGLSGALTIGADNDIVAMNSITYQDCGSTPPGNPNAGNPNSSSPVPTTASQLCAINTGAGAVNDILGLIATNFVEVNHPIVKGTGGSGKNEPLCGTTGAFNVTSSGIGDVACDQSNPRIDAVALALQHSFTVNNFSVGQQLGVINVNGVIAEYYVDIDGSSPGGNCGNSTGCGYNYLQYNWDNRLDLIAPPYYLSPGTPSWTINAFADSNSCSASCVTPLPTS